MQDIRPLWSEGREYVNSVLTNLSHLIETCMRWQFKISANANCTLFCASKA